MTYPHWKPTSDLCVRRFLDTSGAVLGERVEQRWQLHDWTLEEEPYSREEWRPTDTLSLPLVNEHLHWVRFG